jgi:hypothetical protein
MPANMMKAAVGDLEVIGSSSAMVQGRAKAGQHADRGPERGAEETPQRFIGVSATAEAVERARRRHMSPALTPPTDRACSIAFSTGPAPMMPSVWAKPK